MSDLLTRLARSLREHPGVSAEPSDDPPPARAAVLIALRSDAADPELLLIRRAKREGDPWSGQIALPGGRWQPGDPSLMETALRETREEIGLDAPPRAVLGALDDLRPRSALLPSIVVTPWVAAIAAPGPLMLNHEVAEAFWVPWAQLTDPANDQLREVQARGSTWVTPSFVIGEHIVWGMTERILRQLMARVLP